MISNGIRRRRKPFLPVHMLSIVCTSFCLIFYLIHLGKTVNFQTSSCVLKKRKEAKEKKLLLSILTIDTMDSTELPEGTDKELLDAINGNLEAIKVNDEVYFVPIAVHGLIVSSFVVSITQSSFHCCAR